MKIHMSRPLPPPIAAVFGAVDEQGELRNTSFGTAIGDTLEFYKNVPLTAMPYGQSMACLSLVEYLLGTL